MTNQTNLYTHPEAKPEEKSLRRWQEIALARNCGIWDLPLRLS